MEVAILESDVLDVCEGVLDLIPGGVVVNVIREAGLFGGIKDDQIHGILTHSTPCSYA